jgi:Ciliary basal body-associated, B9 protein
MSLIYGSKPSDDRNIKDYTYGAETGFLAHGLPEEYKHPDDSLYTRKGEPIKQPPLPPLEVSEEIYNPESELVSFLYMNITGQIETSDINISNLLQVKYTFITGSEWSLIEGQKSGESQFAKKVPGSEFVTWNLEFSAGYRTLAPEGWPKIVVELLSPTNDPNKFNVMGYACIHTPTSPGITIRKAKIFCPIKDNWWNTLKGKILGPKCDIIEDPDRIADPENREVTAVFFSGVLKIVFNVTQRNFERFGYKTFQ